jgi:hypothetical protein
MEHDNPGRRDIVEVERLNQLDSDLRREADEFLLGSGLGRLISAAGYAPVGSYAMRTMVWRDLDFERMTDNPDWRVHWEWGQALAEVEGVYRLSCIDAYRDSHSMDFGLYWGVRVSGPNGAEWKLDLWTARPDEFAPGLALRAKWMNLLTEASRLDVLAIKEALCTHAEYRKTVLSVHVYEAVLEHGIRNAEGFWDWWTANVRR